MEVAWNQLDPRLRGVDGLDDIMRFDLQHFCRRMQPPDEPHCRSHTLSHVTRAAKSSSDLVFLLVWSNMLCIKVLNVSN